VDITVHHAEQLPDGMVRLITEITDSEGEQRLGFHFFPADSVEWRVAQFNITPEQALDMVVQEPYLKDNSVEHDLQPKRSLARQLATEAVAEAGTITYAEGPLPGEMTASPNAVADSGEDDPLAFLLDVMPIDDGIIATKRELMDANRAVVQEAAGVETPVVVRRIPPSPPPLDHSHYATAIEESPSELAERMIASRLEQVRTSRSVSDPA
jgi:hypothetical protein